VTGLVACQEGYQHRPTAVVCEVPGETPDGPPSAGGVGGAGGESGELPRADGTVKCEDDTALCDAFDLGYCQPSGGGGGFAVCRSGCRTDQECDQSEICLCEAGSLTGGTCVSTDCVTDRDCGDGFRCALADGNCGYPTFACQDPEDECSANADCSEGYCVGGWGEPHRFCGHCPTPGRPFVVAGGTRVAEACAVSGWNNDGSWTLSLAALSASERLSLAEHWTRAGQMEHASIAAFARFALQLLSLGAPPQLLEECTRALADETAHARLCFEIASAYAGRTIGPGPLNVAGSLDVTSLGDIVDLVILEGCFGETNAALEALEAAGGTEDPVIAAAYARIAEDEQRHAELAFRFVRWALERDPLLVRERLRAVLVCPPTNDACAEDLVVPVLYALLRNGASRELAA
jgi:hypothetical protein